MPVLSLFCANKFILMSLATRKNMIFALDSLVRVVYLVFLFAISISKVVPVFWNSTHIGILACVYKKASINVYRLLVDTTNGMNSFVFCFIISFSVAEATSGFYSNSENEEFLLPDNKKFSNVKYKTSCKDLLEVSCLIGQVIRLGQILISLQKHMSQEIKETLHNWSQLVHSQLAYRSSRISFLCYPNCSSVS